MEPEGSIPRLKRPSPVPILSQISPVHAPNTLLEDPFCYYPPIYPYVFQVVSFLRFPTKILYTPVFFSIRATRLTHFILLDSIAQIIFYEQCRSLSTSLCSLLHSLFKSSFVRTNIFLSTLFSNTFSLCPSLTWQTKFHTHKNNRYSIRHLDVLLFKRCIPDVWPIRDKYYAAATE